MQNLFLKRNIFYGYIVLAIICLVYLLTLGFVTYATPIINVLILSELSFNEALPGIASVIFSLMQAFVAPLVGRGISKNGIRIYLIIGCIISGIGAYLMSIIKINEFLYLLLYATTMGIGFGLAGQITTQSGVNEWFKDKKALAMSLLLVAGSIGAIITPIIVSFILEAGNHWSIIWKLFAYSSFLAAALSFMFIKNKPSDIGEIPDGNAYHYKKNKNNAYNNSQKIVINKIYIIDFLKHNYTYSIIYNVGICKMLYIASIVYIPIFLSSRNMTLIQISLITSFIGISSLIGRVLIGIKFFSSINKKYTMSFSALMMAIGILGIIFWGYSTNITIVFSSFIGLGSGLSFIITPLIFSEYFGEENFSTIYGYSFVIINTISAFGPAIIGIAFNMFKRYEPVFILCSIMTIIGSIIILKLPENYHSKIEQNV